ncbi:MAG: ArnT family glycosyltransferase [bacterium]
MLENQSKTKLKNRLIVIWLLGCLAVGGFLRLYNLGGPSVWVDELNHFYAGKSLLENGTPALPSGELYSRALLYSKMVAYSFKLFEINEFSLRLPSALFGLLCILLVYFVARRFFGTTPALLSALFTAISPFAIGWSRISRMYTLFQFLFVLALVSFYLGFEAKNSQAFARWQETLLNQIRLSKLRSFLVNWRLNLFWLLLSFMLLLISYFVHQLTALFFAGLVFYCVIQFLQFWREHGLKAAVKTKYFLVMTGFAFAMLAAVLVIPDFISFLNYALLYLPKWANMPKFQDRKLFLDFIFDEHNFPMGVLFIIGAYQIFSRRHGFGMYSLSVFISCLFLFTFVFSYRHLQYIYSVYPILIMTSAFAFSNIIKLELPGIKARWFPKSRWQMVAIKGLVVGLFLAWLPLTPALRLTKSIPFNDAGGFNGAIYLTELRQACDFVQQRMQEEDVLISPNALGTQFYLGRVDYDLNFADLDLAKEKALLNEQDEYFDLYTGKPFVESVAQLQALMEKEQRIWIISESYKFYRASVYLPVPLRKFVLAHFQKALTTKDGTMVVFKYEKERLD